MPASQLLVTGGSGLLGTELKKILPEALFPSSTEFNITDFEQMDTYVQGKELQTILHGAAFTSPPKVEQDPTRGISVNIVGTANLVQLCIKNGFRLIYISTDYVFRGDQGNYKEGDPVFPVNKYAWSKLGGECAVRLYDNSLIVRTTFGPNVFPYPKAFKDQWTSRESVAIISAKIAGLLDKDIKGTVHVGGERKTVFEYAVGLDKNKPIESISVEDVNFVVPRDTSLCVEKYKSLVEKECGK